MIKRMYQFNAKDESLRGRPRKEWSYGVEEVWVTGAYRRVKSVYRVRCVGAMWSIGGQRAADIRDLE